jgi:putative transposase
MAYQEADFVQVLYVNTPVHGSRPFQYVHIDHTQLDLELISSRTGKPLGRPWLSFAVDANTRRILAIYLTFNPPSVESVMMVVRDMVRRHGRLPQFIVVDNGADFRATAFGKFLEAMGVHLRPRPPGQPRHGAVLERVFGTAHTQYVHNLAGNTKAMKNVRMVTGKHMPVHLAEWSLEPMYFGIEYWAFVYYDQHHHPALDCSPQEAFMRGVRQSGERPQRCIRFGEDFLIATCPPVDRTGSRRVDNQRGVKVADMHYWSPEFREEQWSGQSVPVRYDPWDASSVYVRLKDRWVRARCRNLLALGQLTDFERRALSEEYVHRSGTAADKEQDAQRLREFMQVFTPEGAMALAFEREAENKSLYNRLQLSSVNPVAAPAKTRLIEEPRQESTPAVRMRPSTDITSEPSETPAADHPLDFELF